jgi:hypothetical protein
MAPVSDTPARFDPAEVFGALAMQRIDGASFEREVLAAPAEALCCVFLWGDNCYNCNLFKQAALLHREALLALNLNWFECDVYADPAFGRKFSLHGVPAFMLFRGGKRLGRISGWPGLPRFTQAIEGLQAQTAGNSV